MSKRIYTTILFCAFAAIFTLSAQSSLAGIWKTVDDKTGEAKSHIEIYQEGDKFFGKVSKILTDNKDAVCEECDGKRKNQPVLGMVIVEGLESYKEYWKNGTIIDPESGSEYKLSVWFEDGKTDELQVRGKHWTGLYRTQIWYRAK